MHVSLFLEFDFLKDSAFEKKSFFWLIYSRVCTKNLREQRRKKQQYVFFGFIPVFLWIWRATGPDSDAWPVNQTVSCYEAVFQRK